MKEKISSERFACELRIRTLQMVHQAKASHIGSCFSMADLLAVIYSQFLQFDPQSPQWHCRDRFILSKGHGAAIFYATLSACGFFPDDWLDNYCKDGAQLMGHVTYGVPGVELSAGALGHGLPVGLGMALAAKSDGLNNTTYVLMSDGECNEGSVWEAALLAPQLNLSNLVVIIDYNRIQSFGRTKDIADLDPFEEKWKSFRWNVIEVDGHNHYELEQSLKKSNRENINKPTVIIAHTIKGKGVSYMEDNIEWHYKYPDEEQLAIALAELGFDL